MSTTPSPLRSPEYLAPVPSYVAPVPNPNRLCEPGCHRTNLLLLLEAEFGIEVDGGATWPLSGIAIVNGDFIYYHKPTMQEQLQAAFTDEMNSLTDPVVAASTKAAMDFLGVDLPCFDYILMQDIDANIKNNTAGMPPFVEETTSFYKFQNVIGTPVSFVDATPDLVQLVKTSFDPACNPFIHPFRNHVYLKDGKLYSLAIQWFSTKFNKLDFGFFASENGNKMFYPFAPLTDEQTAWVGNFTGYNVVNI